MKNLSSSNSREELVPKLRFPEFQGEWVLSPLSFYLYENTERNKKLQYSKKDVLSVSGEYGIVNQIEFQGRSFAGASVADYHIVETNDIVYTKSPLKASPYGIIKHNSGISGIVSTLYAVYHPKNNIIPKIIDYYFQNHLRLNSYLKSLVNIGAKHDMKVSNSTVLTGIVIFPKLKEQEKIVRFLMLLDERIRKQREFVESLKSYKRGALKVMFPQNGEDVPSMRFKGFTDAWEQRKLGEIVEIYDGVHQTPKYQDSGIMFLSVENISTLQSEKYISEEDFKRDYKVYPQKNDILMTRIGDVGTTNIVTDNGLKAYYVSLALLKYKNTNPYFLSNAIQSDFVQKGLENRTLKTAIPMKINKDEIGKVDVMLPISSAEQQQIGTYFRNLDNLITLHQRKVDKSERLKQSLLKQLFI